MGGCLSSSTPSEEDESTVRASLPTSCCVAFKSLQADGNSCYLCYDAHGGITGAGKSLRLNGEGVTSPHSRFYIEPSRVHNRLVHIRCCYDNKYWVAGQRRPLQPGGGWVIIGTADEAEEDLSKPTCTLFRTIRVAPNTIRLLHVHLEKHACLPLCSGPERSSLSLLTGDEEDDDVIATFTVHDLSEQFVLPRHLAFKGDNGKYLRVRRPYLQFSGRHVRDEAALHTVHTNNDGTFRLMSSHAGNFWWRSPNWIWIESTGDPASDGQGDDALFRAIRLPEAGGLFALQSLGNEYFCRRLTLDGKWNCLNAATPTITPEARLDLEEPVVSREVCNVVFDLSEPRMYGRSTVTMATASALNRTTSSSTAQLTLEYKDTGKRTWASTVTLKLGVPTKISAGAPAIVEDGRLEVSAEEFSGSYCWGSAVDKETARKVAYEVTVPAMTRVTVALTATRASCDVPFTYTQRDTLVDDRQMTYDMDDGLYTGINCYDFKYVTSEENI